VLVPDKVIVPDVLVIGLVLLKLIPTPAPDPDAIPVIEIFPLPVVVETTPVPLILTPCEAVLLDPPVPASVIEPPPNVLKAPVVIEIPCEAPAAPSEEAPILIEAFNPDAVKVLAQLKPTPPLL
jgi:hypothetical protein